MGTVGEGSASASDCIQGEAYDGDSDSGNALFCTLSLSLVSVGFGEDCTGSSDGPDCVVADGTGPCAVYGTSTSDHNIPCPAACQSEMDDAFSSCKDGDVLPGLGTYNEALWVGIFGSKTACVMPTVTCMNVFTEIALGNAGMGPCADAGIECSDECNELIATFTNGM